MFGHASCIWLYVGRVPTRSAPTSSWGGRGPHTGRNGSFPPASEREARMDDPMIRSRLRPNQGTRPLGTLDPKRGSPTLFCSSNCFIRFPLVDCSVRSKGDRSFQDRSCYNPWHDVNDLDLRITGAAQAGAFSGAGRVLEYLRPSEVSLRREKQSPPF